MTFVPRHPVIVDQFCTHDATNNSTANAGAVVYLTGTDATNKRGKVSTVSGTGNAPYGFLTQKVKAESSDVPTGYRWPGDLGSSDAYSGDPVGVAHLGIYDTTDYVLNTGNTTFTAGELLYASIAAASKGKVTNGTTTPDVAQENSSDKVVAKVVVGLTATEVAAGTALRIQILI